MERAMLELFEINKKKQETMSPSSSVDAFFEFCRLRMRNLDPALQSTRQMQVSQLFYNAENPEMPSQLMVPLPNQLSCPDHNSLLVATPACPISKADVVAMDYANLN